MKSVSPELEANGKHDTKRSAGKPDKPRTRATNLRQSGEEKSDKRAIFRSVPLGVTAVATLVLAASCLAPGSLDQPETFRVSKGPSAGGGSAAGMGGNSTAGAGTDNGCKAACVTFHTTCSTASCHTTISPAGTLDLQSPGIIARISNKPAQTAPCPGETLLAPGDPAKSIIYTKLLEPPSCGLKMPLTGMVTSAEVECVRKWVLSPSCDDEPGMAPGGMGGAASGTGGSPSGGSAPSASPGGTSSNGGASGTGGAPAGGGAVYVEAESGTLAAPMASSMDAAASGGKYVSVPADATTMRNDNPMASTMGIAAISFMVTTAGSYGAFGRMQAASTNNDSFWVKMDMGDWTQWNNLANATWTWVKVHDSANADAPVTYMLTAGVHTFSVAYREPGAQLDELAFSTDGAFMPTGAGQ